MITMSPSTVAPPLRAPRLAGFRTLLAKDLAEWRHGPKAWVLALASVLVWVLSSANARIVQAIIAVTPPTPGEAPQAVGSLLPSDNLLLALGTQTIVLLAVVATMGLLVTERERGTLGWTASKPASRTSILVSKWVSATAMLWVTTVAVPLVATAAVVTVLYGAPDPVLVLAVGFGLVAVPAIWVAIALAASTFVNTQAAVAGIGIVAFVVPLIVGGLVPAIVPLVPTSILDWVVASAAGAALGPLTPIAWLLGLAVLLAVAQARFERMEL